MDTVRYVFGCLVVITLPPGVAWWFVIHPFADFWRRVGGRVTISIGMMLLVLSMVPLYWIRDTLLILDLGPSWFMAAVGAVALVGAWWIAIKRKKYLTLRILIGLPELEEGGKGGTLLTEGPYSLSRNPRYLEMILGVFGYTAFSNYVGAYIVALLTVPAIHLIVIMEEAELRERFGAEYEDYLARVPRYLPPWGSWLRPGPEKS
jgi:protein-S-isoprenylcysteine O-methyltransferase Ste14